MEFDFYHQFKAYPTVELVRIISEPGHYQADAIAAAERLLHERNVSREERDGADLLLREEEAEKMARSQQREIYKEQIADIVLPVMQPTPSLQPARWFKSFLFVFGVYYIICFYLFIKNQIYFLQCERCEFGGQVVLNFIGVTYLSVTFFLLLKNKRWAWIMMMAANIADILMGAYRIYVLYKYKDVIHVSVSEKVFTFAFPIAIVLFLWRPVISDYFGVTGTTKRRTLQLGILFGLVFDAIKIWVL